MQFVFELLNLFAFFFCWVVDFAFTFFSRVPYVQNPYRCPSYAFFPIPISISLTGWHLYRRALWKEAWWAMEIKIPLNPAWLVRVGRDASRWAARPPQPWALGSRQTFSVRGPPWPRPPWGIEFFQLILFLSSSLRQMKYPYSEPKSGKGHPSHSCCIKSRGTWERDKIGPNKIKVCHFAEGN